MGQHAARPIQDEEAGIVSRGAWLLRDQLRGQGEIEVGNVHAESLAGV